MEQNFYKPLTFRSLELLRDVVNFTGGIDVLINYLQQQYRLQPAEVTEVRLSLTAIEDTHYPSVEIIAERNFGPGTETEAVVFSFTTLGNGQLLLGVSDGIDQQSTMRRREVPGTDRLHQDLLSYFDYGR